MSRWEKRSQEEKEQIALRQSPEFIAKQAGKVRLINIRETCFRAKAKAGHEKEMCHACDLRCPGCPFESAWPEKAKPLPQLQVGIFKDTKVSAEKGVL